MVNRTLTGTEPLEHRLEAALRHGGRRDADQLLLCLNEAYQMTAQGLYSAPTPEEALHQALTALKSWGFYAPRIYGKENGTCTLVKGLDLRPGVEKRFSFRSDNPVYQRLFVEGQQFYVSQNTRDKSLLAGDDDPSLTLPEEATGLLAMRYKVHSLALEKDVAGIMVANFNPKHRFANGNLDSYGARMLSFIGNLVPLVVARLIENQHAQQLTETLRYMATHDDLSPLYNRRQMHQDLEDLWKRSLEGIYTAEMLLDADKLKRINDTLGHPKGDEVLAEVGSLVYHLTADYTREHAGMILKGYRNGGDEFVVTFEGQQGMEYNYFESQVTDFAQVFLTQAHDLKSVPEHFKPTSASAGIVINYKGNFIDAGKIRPVSKNNPLGEGSYSADSEGWHRRADDALLEAKDGGRDQAALYALGGKRIIRP